MQWANRLFVEPHTEHSAISIPPPFIRANDLLHGKPIKLSEIWLGSFQRDVLRLVQLGENVFFTGPVGSTTTELTRIIIDALRAKYDPRGRSAYAVIVTAITCRMLVEFGAIGILDWAGINGDGNEVDRVVSEIVSDHDVFARWQACKALVIIESCLLPGHVFARLDAIARRVRNHDHTRPSLVPWGGIQLVLTGDLVLHRTIFELEAGGDHLFDCDEFLLGVPHRYKLPVLQGRFTIALETVLSELRRGEVTAQSMRLLAKRQIGPSAPADRHFTYLYPFFDMVMQENQRQFAQLSGEEVVYTALDHVQQGLQAEYGQCVTVSEEIRLRVGARVMLVRDMTSSLRRGMMGSIIGFEVDGFRTGTTHGPVWPVVRMEGRVPLDVLFTPITFEIRDKQSKVVFTRMQLPLVISWALHIDMADDIKLDGVKVDLASGWPDLGQVYRALSKAQKLHDIRLINFSNATIDDMAVHWLGVGFDRLLDEPPRSGLYVRPPSSSSDA